MLMDKNLPTTVGFITNDQDLMKSCDMVFVLEKGTLLASGSFEQVRSSLPRI
jgi:ABC-type branched-subunit amino acid transport system ATPase component